MTRFTTNRLLAAVGATLVVSNVCAALVNFPAHHSLEVRGLSSYAAQNPFDGLKLLAEGQALVRQQTDEASTKAIAKLKEAFAVFQKSDFKLGMGGALLWEGIAYDSLGKPREALSAFNDASRYFNESGFGFLDPVQQAIIGVTYANQGESEKAIEVLSQVLGTLRQANIPRFLAYALKGLGDAQTQIGQKHKAIEYLTEALDIYRRSDDWVHEVQVLPLISALKTSLGQSSEALKFARAAVDRAKERSSADWEAYGYFAVGAAYASMGKLREAAEAYNRSLSLLENHKDYTGEATALNNLGLIRNSLGDLGGALEYFKKAVTMAKSGDDPRLAAYATNNIGTIYYRRGEPLKGLRCFEEALAEAQRSKDKRLKATVLSSMADAYFSVNSREYALKVLEENAAVFGDIEEPAKQVEVSVSLADAYGALTRYREALAVLHNALASSRITEDQNRQGYVLREMGYIYASMGDQDNAKKSYAEALSKFTEAGDAGGQIDLYAAMGSAAVATGDYKKAEELLTGGLALARAGGLRQSESLILALLGSVREKQGDSPKAESLYDQAISIRESLRSSAGAEELKTAVGDVSAVLLTPAILLKFKLGKLAEAFNLSEQFRARTFLDQINSTHIDIRKEGNPELVKEEQAIRLEIRALEKDLSKARRENSRSETAGLLAANLKEAQERYAAILVRLKVSNPHYADLHSYVPTPVGDIQRLLGRRQTLLSYFVTSDKTLAFIVRSNSLQAVSIPVKETDLRAAIEWFRAFPSLRDRQLQSLRQLHDWLVAPIKQYIGQGEVMVIPHGILHYVPFAALTDGSRFFGDDHALSYLPSASILQTPRRRIESHPQRVFAVSQSGAEGEPQLGYADNEVASVAQLYHTQALKTGSATRTRFLTRAPAANIVHVAAHATLNTTAPLFSRILLSPDHQDDGAVEVREIYGMDLRRTDLVVLSACQTQLGAQSKGDDIVGLNRAFIYAGASSVIASLWTVDDQATSYLMRAFYGYLKTGMSKAEALQAAQAATRRRYPHPYYWAAFVLTGDPGRQSKSAPKFVH